MTQRSALLEWIEKLDTAKVLVVGDIMLDRFVYGDVSRISPEGPVPVLKSMKLTSVLGGAGNVVRNLAALGAATLLVSLTGSDDEADQVRALLSELPRSESHLIADHERRTTVKTRFLSKQQQLLRVDSETPHTISPSVELEALERIKQGIVQCDVCILSDYGKGFLSPSLLNRTISFCRESRKPVLVDPKGLDYSIYRGATILTPNLKELGEATRTTPATDAAVVDAARALIDLCQLKAVLATRSQDGMSLVESTGAATHFRSEAREVFDVTGAGDTVIAALGAALSAGAPLAESSEIANIAAGIVVGKAGTAVTYVREMVHALRHQELSTAESKVLSLEAAVDRVEIWRRKGYKTGFLNGFFELLHPAHVQLFAKAARACDRLIVGINSDASICRIKGELPILHESARSAIIASLEDVDMVVIFHDDTPSILIDALKPDVHIKRARFETTEVAISAGGQNQNSGQEVLMVEIQDSAMPRDPHFPVAP